MARHRWGRCGTLHEVVTDPLWGPYPRLLLRWPPNWLVLVAWAVGVDHRRYWPPPPAGGWFGQPGYPQGCPPPDAPRDKVPCPAAGDKPATRR
jgi:hypothetical protein